MLYKAGEWISLSGKVNIQCEDLIGTGRNWIEPARILGISPTDFILMIKNEYNAIVKPFKREDGSISFIDYHWNSLEEGRKWKNYINKIARERKYTI